MGLVMDDQQRAHHGRDLREGRVSLPGQPYLLTLVTRYRQRYFEAFTTARQVVLTLHDPDVVRRADTIAFVAMPDHLHWLLQLKNTDSLEQTVRLYKAKVTRALGIPVWQRGFHDHALRREEDLRDAARYIIANPLRAGLVERIGDYPHWDCVWL